MLKEMFKDTFEHLGVQAVYQSQTSGIKDVLVLIKQPETLHELGDGGSTSQFVQRIASFEIMASDVANPMAGDFLTVNGRKYKVYQEPLLDGSCTVYEIVAILVWCDND